MRFIIRSLLMLLIVRLIATNTEPTVPIKLITMLVNLSDNEDLENKNCYRNTILFK